MREPCASIQIEVTPSPLEYSCDYIKDTLQVCRLSFLLLCVCELHLIPLFPIKMRAFPLDSNVSTTKQQHTQQLQLGSEQEKLHPFKQAGIRSSKHKHAFLIPKCGLWTLCLGPAFNFLLKRQSLAGLYPLCLIFRMSSLLSGQACFLFCFMQRNLIRATASIQSFFFFGGGGGGRAGKTWVGGQRRLIKDHYLEDPQRDFLRVITCYIFMSVLNIMH